DHQIAVERERQTHAAVLDAKRKRFAHLSLSDALAAARRLTFINLEAERKGETAPLNRPSLTLVELFLTVLKERGSVAVLQWPRGLRDVSILHPLAMLGILGSAPEQVTGAFHWCLSVPDFRTIYYPWRGSGTGIIQRRALVDRTEITRRNQLHLT